MLTRVQIASSVTPMGSEYEVRRVGKYFEVVHIRSGYAVERRIKYRSYADALCRRFNGSIN